jgi:hypothetical protein
MAIRITGFFLVIGILFSYVPVFPMNQCPEGKHMGSMKMDCGSLFHCPMIVDKIFSESSALPLRGCLVPIKLSLAVDEFPEPIFHPPEHLTSNSYLREENQLGMEPWHKNCC